jgi:hypothetical protein
LVKIDPEAYLTFDDTVLEKSFGPKIEMVRKQYSGNKKWRNLWRGVVSCVYVNPKMEHALWVVRIIRIDGARLRRIRRERALSKRDLLRMSGMAAHGQAK